MARRAKRLFGTAIPFADAGRAIEEIAGLDPERAGHLGDAAAADAVLAALIFLDLLKRVTLTVLPSCSWLIFMVKRRPAGGDRHTDQWDRPWQLPPYRNRKLPRKRALRWNGQGLICYLAWDLVGFDRSAA